MLNPTSKTQLKLIVISIMKKLILLFFALVLFSSHDMYLKLDATYFLQPNASASIQLFNGTFDLSENVITRDRMIDVSLVGNSNRTNVDTTQWSEKYNTTILNFETGEEGTWVAGVSTRARNIEMNAEDFNGYLEHDGVLDMLDWRKANNAMDQGAVEKYSKHVKTIFQVGEKRTDDWNTELGYPIEFIPLANPYDLKQGDELQVQLLWKGEPLTNQLVYIGSSATSHQHSHDHEDDADHNHSHANDKSHSHDHDDDHDHNHDNDKSHSHDHSHDNEKGHSHDHDHEDGAEHSHDHEEEANAEDHQHDEMTQARTDEEGKFNLKITEEGIWYLRTIYLTLSEEAGLTHESNWATLTFEVGHSHGDEVTHSHDDDHHHDHENSEGIPAFAYWLGSLLLLGGLFLWFNRK